MPSETFACGADTPPQEASNLLHHWLESQGDLDDFIFFFEEDPTPSER